MTWKRVFSLLAVFGGLMMISPAKAATVDICGEKLQAPSGVSKKITALCGFNQPEDFDLTPDGRHILVGDLGMTVTPQGMQPSASAVEMSVIDTVTDRVSKLERVWDKGPNWGDPSCPARDPKGRFYVLGMKISTRAPGVTQLMIINNLGGDHVEFYQLQEKNGTLKAAWRGCVQAPRDGTVDAVAALPDGGFVASVICNNPNFASCMEAAKRGENTGWMIAWTPKGGMRRLPNSDAQLNNGLEVTRDGQHIVMIATGTREVKVYSLAEQKFVRSIAMPFAPDNGRLTSDGALLVGGTDGGHLCLGKRAAGCTNPSWVMTVKPEDGRKELLFYADNGLLSGTTGGILVGNSLYITSLSDPFILKVRVDR